MPFGKNQKGLKHVNRGFRPRGIILEYSRNLTEIPKTQITQTSSFRFISLLNNASKILDKALVRLLEEQMHSLNKFSYSQHGGRKGYSTLTAITKITDGAANFLNQKGEKIVHVIGLGFAQ